MGVKFMVKKRYVTLEWPLYANRRNINFLVSVSAPVRWTDLLDAERKTIIMRLFDSLDVSEQEKRMRAVRAILYLIQG